MVASELALIVADFGCSYGTDGSEFVRTREGYEEEKVWDELERKQQVVVCYAEGEREGGGKGAT